MQFGHVLERVKRDDTVVMISREQKHCRILHGRILGNAQSMQWRKFNQVVEMFFLVRVAIIRHPLMKAFNKGYSKYSLIKGDHF